MGGYEALGKCCCCGGPGASRASAMELAGLPSLECSGLRGLGYEFSWVFAC